MVKKVNANNEESLEKKLWKSADKLRKNMDATEYKHIVLGLIFLKYISDAFEELYHIWLSQKSDGADLKDRNEYLAENVFYLPATLNFEEMNSDSAVQGLNRDNALSSEILKTPGNKINEFNNTCLVIFGKIKTNIKQIRTLTQLRDILLPKLMSGGLILER